MHPPLEPGKVYHIFNHANGSDNLFREADNYHYFLKKYAEYMCPVVDTYAYCLMPNYFHLMARVKGEEQLLEFLHKKEPDRYPLSLQGFQTLEGMEVGFSKLASQQFSNLFNGYTQAFNKKWSRRGSLFQPRFKRKEVSSETYFSTLVHYIHNNPVHHGFCSSPYEWPHSSIHTFTDSRNTKLDRDTVLDWFGGITAFREFHVNPPYGKLASEIFIETTETN